MVPTVFYRRGYHRRQSTGGKLGKHGGKPVLGTDNSRKIRNPEAAGRESTRIKTSKNRSEIRDSGVYGNRLKKYIFPESGSYFRPDEAGLEGLGKKKFGVPGKRTAGKKRWKKNPAYQKKRTHKKHPQQNPKFIDEIKPRNRNRKRFGRDELICQNGLKKNNK